MSKTSYLPAPSYLDKAEKAEWRKLIDSQPDDYFNTGHVDLIYSYVCSALQLRVCSKQLKDEGYTAEGSQGQTIQHPAVRMRSEAIKNLKSIAESLGIDPKSQQSRQAAERFPTFVGGESFDGLVE